MKNRLEGINELTIDIFTANKARGFWENENIGEKLALVHSEISEALEADRAGLWLAYNQNVADFYRNAKKTFKENPALYKVSFEASVKNCFEDEIADSIIRLFDMCGRFNIDIEKHIELKLMYNSLRESKHGKKY